MTAREFLISKRLNGWANHTVVSDLMVDFAKYHVTLALQAAANNHEDAFYESKTWWIPSDYILTSYPLENIK